jgi:hypothetical protein
MLGEKPRRSCPLSELDGEPRPASPSPSARATGCLQERAVVSMNTRAQLAPTWLICARQPGDGRGGKRAQNRRSDRSALNARSRGVTLMASSVSELTVTAYGAVLGWLTRPIVTGPRCSAGVR